MNTALLKKLTIAIPVYNDEKYIRQTVESCIGQADQIIIYDNASTDGTGNICAQLAQQHASVSHVRHPLNVGAFENFHISLFNCETEYFCWVGSHDLLAPGYAQHILPEMEKSADASLGVGKIIYIDEDSKETGKVTQSLWTNALRDKSALDRAGICATKIKDCFLFYGIQRTAHAQTAWIEQPSLGFDRAYLCNLAAQGTFLYISAATFLARDLDKSRKNINTNTRRIKDIGLTGDATLAKDLVHRNKRMVQTILNLAKTDRELGIALEYISKMNRRYSSRKKYQKLRIAKAGAAILLLAFFFWISSSCG